MVFAPRNASVVELSLKPNCNRCFGYMAMSLGLDYWMVPQISSHYEGFYEMTDDGAQSIVTLIKKILLLPSHNNDQNQAQGMIDEKKISKMLQYHPADMIPRNMKVLRAICSNCGINRSQPFKDTKEGRKLSENEWQRLAAEYEMIMHRL
jgi:hypothetical protein